MSAEDTIKARWSAVTDEGTTRSMAFDRDGGTPTELAPEPGMKIFVMRADGTELQQLTDNQWEEGTPSWRPMR